MSNPLERLSERERRLAAATITLVLAGLVFFAVRGAWGRLQELDTRIETLEQELINLHEQEARSASIEQAYRAVAAEHSSAWTKEEIFDRLRREIHRLALTEPQLADEAEVTRSRANYLVNIPILREGVLTDEGEGYREYQLSFRIQPAGLANVLKYLERLQSSRQLLRIDHLDLGRAPSGTEINTYLEVTRTVVDSPYDNEETSASRRRVRPGHRESFEFEVDDGSLLYWQTSGVDLDRDPKFATHGEFSLAVTASGEAGSLYQVQELEGGKLYRLTMDVASTAPARVSIQDSEKELPGSVQDLKSDGQPYRYQFEFQVPGDKSQHMNLKAPHLALQSADGRIFVDNVLVTEVEGS